jgi:hypothetical protein
LRSEPLVVVEPAVEPAVDPLSFVDQTDADGFGHAVRIVEELRAVVDLPVADLVGEL